MADVWMGVILLAGGLVVSGYALYRAENSAQRCFLLRVCALIWLEVVIFIVAVLKTPRPYSFLVCLPYFIIGPVTWTVVRRRWSKLLEHEPPAAADSERTRAS